MECSTIMASASRSAIIFHCNLHNLSSSFERHFKEDGAFLVIDVSSVAAQQTSQNDLFEKLPNEVMDMILEQSDLQSVYNLASVCRRLRRSISMSRNIAPTRQSAAVSYAFRRLMRAKCAKFFTLLDFAAALRNPSCASCPEKITAGLRLNLDTGKRMCNECAGSEYVYGPSFAEPMVLLPYLQSGFPIQFETGRICRGCRRHFVNGRQTGAERTGAERTGAERTMPKKTYVEVQFLRHFSTCEFAWKLAAGQHIKSV